MLRALSLTFAFGVACLLGVADPVIAQEPSYVIGPQDVLTITVYDEADLSGKFIVEADDTFTFPLIGRVTAGGLTLRALETEMRARLADGFFKRPQVSVAVEQYRSQRIFIVGEVRNPGTYVLSGEMRLIEALSRAGSSLPTSSGEALIVRPKAGASSSGPVLPTDAGTAQVMKADINALQSGALAQNIRLADGDTIYVPRAETVYVFGQVKNPGAYAVQKQTTVLQALSLAGGMTDRGATTRIKIIRMIQGRRKEIKVKLTDLVEPGDTIMVPERFF